MSVKHENIDDEDGLVKDESDQDIDLGDYLDQEGEPGADDAELDDESEEPSEDDLDEIEDEDFDESFDDDGDGIDESDFADEDDDGL